MVATLPAQPYITGMIPVGVTDDGSMTFRMTGFFAEVFDNLQVRKASPKEFMANLYSTSSMIGFSFIAGYNEFYVQVD